MQCFQIHYERLNAGNFNIHSLDDFVRHQKVSECWRNVNGEKVKILFRFLDGITGEYSTPECYFVDEKKMLKSLTKRFRQKKS